ncbi:MAG TPA: FAD-dependent monooxygenase [Pseudonocardiaceae bacterium]|jgi:anthraniloyl-CoA monooxygenase|nr:FAD-dependent monooxygenase [Pseudonocardiaceae bacterium]
MRIVCIGGGPGGLYFAISAKLRDAGHDVTVVERDPPGATYGWGVVYWDDLLDILFRNDPDSARAVRAQSMLWQEQRVLLRSAQTAYLPGYGFSVGRAILLEVLAKRATELGIEVQHCHEADDISAVADADLVVVCDGANSRVRQRHSDHFGARVDIGGNPYIWLGTDKIFDSFTFAFEQTSAGWIWFHAYPSGAEISTCIVECTYPTWQALGFDSLNNEEITGLLEEIFEDALDGHTLISQSRGQAAQWLRFAQVTNKTWHHDNLVLVGDAAHTTHFTLGSGTRLAMIDAIVLAQCLYEHDELPAALQDYDRRGRAALRPIQAGARTSMAWFERADRYLNQDAVPFAYAMSGRHGAHPPWRYQMHLATQIPPLRTAQRGFHTARRWYLARRRGEPITAPTPITDSQIMHGPLFQGTGLRPRVRKTEPPILPSTSRSQTMR